MTVGNCYLIAESLAMGEWGTAVASAMVFVGLIAGYFVGYRSGIVAGELEAMKSHRSSNRHRERRDGNTKADA